MNQVLAVPTWATTLGHLNQSVKEGASFSASSFGIAFWFMDARRRRALATVYALARLADDIADLPHHTPRQKAIFMDGLEELLDDLLAGRLELSRLRSVPELHDFLSRVQWAHRQYRLSSSAIFDLISGCRMDISPVHFSTRDELMDYCYRVAGTVGILCVSIFKDAGFHSLKFATHLGYSFQLINIMRDVAEDFEMRGRVYLPTEDLRQHGITLYPPHRDPRFPDLRRTYAELARTYYEQAIADLDRKTLYGPFLPAMLMAAVYLRLLDRVTVTPIEQRASLSFLDKLFAIGPSLSQAAKVRMVRS